MLTALYGATSYADAEFGQGRMAISPAMLTETVTASVTMGNIVVFKATPSLRTFIVPTEKRNNS